MRHSFLIAAVAALSLVSVSIVARAGDDGGVDVQGTDGQHVKIDGNGVHVQQPGQNVNADGDGVTGSSNGQIIPLLGNSQTKTIDCKGGTLQVVGNSNTLTVSNCASVQLQGNSNTVSATASVDSIQVAGNSNRINAGPNAVKSIQVPGNDNVVYWTSRGGAKKPSIQTVGARNKVVTAK